MCVTNSVISGHEHYSLECSFSDLTSPDFIILLTQPVVPLPLLFPCLGSFNTTGIGVTFYFTQCSFSYYITY